MRSGLLTIICLLYCIHLQAQNYYMPAPEGFGAAATGGGNGIPVIVSTYPDLKAKINDPSANVVLVSGIINIPAGGSISAVVNNKSIIGLSGAKLINTTKTQSGSGILYLKNGSSNVIIRNLIFEGPGAYDVDGRDNLTSDGCVDLWVDHCEFQDGIDGNFDIKGNSDNVTVSWCKFTYLKPPTAGGSGGSDDHRFSNLVGSGSSDAPQDKHYSVTFQNCYWANGCRERMPRARNGELHILNCYYNTNVSSSRALGLGGGVNNLTCYVENTNFASIGTVYKNYNSTDGGTVDVNFIGCLNGVAGEGSVSMPTYSYTVLPVEDVETFIPNSECGAGATLQVTPEGDISSPCTPVSANESQNAADIKLYPAIVRETLHINFPVSNDLGAVNIVIYSMDGQVIYSASNVIASNSRIELNLIKLATGTYFCHIQNKQLSITRKFIKG